MQLNIILKYLIINKLIIKKRIYLSARKRYNIKLKKRSKRRKRLRRLR